MDSEDSLSNLELASSVAGGGSTQRRQSGTSESDQQQRPAQQAGLQVHVDLRQPLSLRGDDVEQIVRTRNTDALLRPVYLNAVEVGYAYNQSNDLDKRLPVRGVTIALWYFIARGHQAIALLPYCFKSYPDKSTAWGELMSLYKMNLIEFTPGYGSDKYTEVNRILAIRADETGGCIVARSQMQNIVEECPDLDRIIERRQAITQTLECQDSCDEFPRCALYQMSLDDQRIWLEKLCGLVINNHTLSASWSLMCNSICTSSLTSSALAQFISSRTKAIISTALNGGVPLKPHPPETNPIDNIGYSYTRGALRRAVSEQMYYSNSARPNNANPAPSPSYPSSDLNATTSLNRRYTPSTGNQRQRQNGNDVFIPEYMQCSDEELPQPLSTSIRPAPRQVEQQHPQAGDKSPLAGVPSALTKPVQPPLPNYLGSNANSIYRQDKKS
ncbi:hypothetical protein WR25_14527 [Diploscapter pachys]|uniref:RNase NYN domain-containing protein n=1 Tax=Diploscapter pachys TaxID=2018661 RepID=A0A2A2JU61_9BILA|nr:hypothetical protein WR25_14527 [Diploscapter pachys]